MFPSFVILGKRKLWVEGAGHTYTQTTLGLIDYTGQTLPAYIFLFYSLLVQGLSMHILMSFNYRNFSFTLWTEK